MDWCNQRLLLRPQASGPMNAYCNVPVCFLRLRGHILYTWASTYSRLASSVARSMPRGTAARGFTPRELLSDLSIVEGEPRHRQTTGTLLGTHALLTRSSFGRTPHNNTEECMGPDYFIIHFRWFILVHPESRGSVLSLAQLKLSSTSRSMRLSVICCSAWSGAVPR